MREGETFLFPATATSRLLICTRLSYDAPMLPEHLRGVLRSYSRRRPFQAYQVELVSGARILVEHPEALIMHETPYGFLVVHRGTNGAHTVLESQDLISFIEQPTPRRTTP